MVSPDSVLFALCLAGVARSTCHQPETGSDFTRDTWAFNLYNGSECEKSKSTRYQFIKKNPGVAGCFNINKEVIPVKSASYKGAPKMVGYAGVLRSCL
ncbi:hypothetical protein BJ138DRAFT_1145468 [Hygrophoropsis aurantiaca]|uniref:Uncharacterized protein n=1 Tax=Hygrophoropsis aurantiaca TaxID=72124 RepID=A0ACB8AJG2_9AGAM|nr:hypothetical protein BJ138DRAFT_1145468 [Hygrophoropsis aurantiaca]